MEDAKKRKIERDCILRKNQQEVATKDAKGKRIETDDKLRWADMFVRVTQVEKDKIHTTAGSDAIECVLEDFCSRHTLTQRAIVDHNIIVV